MTLPADNAAKHAIGLGGFGFPVQAYAKRGQENPVSRVQVGSDDFLATDRSSFWTQEDYSGGNYQYEWHDQAMISTSEGVFPNQLSHAVRTTPRLVLGKALSAMSSTITSRVGPADYPRAIYTVKNSVIFCFPRRIVSVPFSVAGGAGAPISDSQNTNPSGGFSYTCFGHDDSLTRVAAGCSDNNVRTFTDSSLGLVATLPGKNEQNQDITGPITMVDWCGDTMVVGFGAYLYMQTDTTKFRKINNGQARPTAGRLPGTPVASCPFNGQLYILCVRSDSDEGVIVSTNCTAVMNVATIPYACRPWCMREYAGRLYVGAVGSDLDDANAFGELYELTGTSLRLVRSFQRERLTQGPVTGPIRNLDVFDGFLIMPNESRQGVEIYDASNDALFTGPCLDLDINFQRPDPTRLMRFVASCKDQIVMWAQHATDATKAGVYRTRVPTVAGGPDPPTTHKGQGSWITSSDFDPEPGRLKTWQKVVFKTRNLGITFAQVSVNGGQSWTTLTGGTAQTDGDVVYTTFVLNGITPSRRLRLQWHVLAGTSTALPYGEFLAHSVSFVFQEHDKHGWQITIPCVYRAELLDETEAPDTEAPWEKLQQLWNWSDNNTVIDFRDRDDKHYKVTLTQCVESEAHVGNTHFTREGYFSCFLVEV